MNGLTKRSRLHLDIRTDLVRAARAKAGFDGIELNAVVSNALKTYLADELAILHERAGWIDDQENARSS
jgi:hypothetical protein